MILNHGLLGLAQVTHSCVTWARDDLPPVNRSRDDGRDWPGAGPEQGGAHGAAAIHPRVHPRPVPEGEGGPGEGAHRR